MPTYNTSWLINRAIKSVLKQTYLFWELIIVDDGSTDNTIEIINEYRKTDHRIKLFLRDRNPKNASTCRNIGANKAMGKYLIFLDSDDELKPHCLEKRVGIMEMNLLDIAVFNQAINSQNIEIEKKINCSRNFLEAFLIHDTIPWQTMCPIWEKKFFTEIGGFDEALIRHQDPELFIRVLLWDKTNIKVFADLESDCLYHNHHHEKDFYLKVYEGSSVFVKKISLLLERKGKENYKHLLKSYLSAYISVVLNSLCDRQKYIKSINLIRTYLKYEVITKTEKNILILYFFIFYICSRIVLKIFQCSPIKQRH
jgi:glycosyltransferase involved in cell wall biosynthesis